MNTDLIIIHYCAFYCSFSQQLLTGSVEQGGSTEPGSVTSSCLTPRYHGKQRTISVSKTGDSFLSSQTQNCWCENLSS